MGARSPRIGRADRLAALHDRAVGPTAVDRLLHTPQQAPARPRTIEERAAVLADLLAPLPRALGEIGTRISRHCAVTARDAELAGMVEQVRARTFELWLAVARLRDAAGARLDR